MKLENGTNHGFSNMLKANWIRVKFVPIRDYYHRHSRYALVLDQATPNSNTQRVLTLKLR